VHLRQREFKDMDFIHVARNRDKYGTPMNTILSFIKFGDLSSPVVFNLFPPVPLETLFHSTLYPQSCWCIIRVIHNYI
jgi:hypothetical protein